MPAMEPLYQLIGRQQWPARTASVFSVSISGAGIQLAADPNGSLSLASPDGSLGLLTLPRGFALDESLLLFILVPGQNVIRRYDAGAHRFVDLPTVGGTGTEARQFVDPGNIAVVGGLIYVVDTGNHRIQVFDQRTLALLHVWDGFGAHAGNDIAAGAGSAYLLDARHGRVFQHRPGANVLRLVIDGSSSRAGRWSRIAVDRAGRIYLFDAAASRLEVFTNQGVWEQTVRDSGDVRDRFERPPIRLINAQYFRLPAGLNRACDRCVERSDPPLNAPAFDRNGRPLAGGENLPREDPRYARRGQWVSAVFDSRIHDCQWHRIELDLAALPPATRVMVSSHSARRLLTKDEVARLDATSWEPCCCLFGQDDAASRRDQQDSQDFLVQSRAGQYLWLKIDLLGNGDDTPLVASLKLHYPRVSYLSYLPAVFSQADDSRWFLERFLSVFQTEWDALEDRIQTLARYFDPDAAPAHALPYLASWLNIPMEAAWDEAQTRRILRAAIHACAARGTVASLRAYVQAYLRNIAKLVEDDDPGPFPVIVEGFRVRHWLQLATGHDSPPGASLPLWSASMTSRLQTDAMVREGEARLVSVGDPQLDIFQTFANRFRVFVPAAWVRGAEAERMLRRALDAETPACASYDLELIEPRLRIGIQSTVGVDTLIGSPAPGVLDDAATGAGLGQDGVIAGSSASGVLSARLPGHNIVLHEQED